MALQKDCNWFGGGASMEKHWARLWWDVRNIFNTKDLNPYHEQKPRPAYKDISHAIVNIPVEYCRECYYRAGHIMFYQSIVILAGIIGGLAYWLL